MKHTARCSHRRLLVLMQKENDGVKMNRRNFLKLLTAGAAGLALPSLEAIAAEKITFFVSMKNRAIDSMILFLKHLQGFYRTVKTFPHCSEKGNEYIYLFMYEDYQGKI